MKKIIGLMTLLCFAGSVSAQTWTAGTADWNTGTSWNTGTVPVNGQNARINNGGTATIAASIPSLHQNNNTLRTVIGDGTGAGSVIQSAGTVLTGNTHIGESGNNPGTYTISGGIFTPRYINVANGGVGILNHTGGTVNGQSWFGIATQGGGRGTYNISGTAVFDRGSIEVGPRSNSDAVLNVSGNADLRVTNLLFDHHAGGSARSQVNLDGGTISVDNIRIEDVNPATPGTSQFNWGSGTLRQKNVGSGPAGGFAVNGPGGEDPQRGGSLQVYSQGQQGTGANINPANASLATGSSINIAGGGNSVLDLGSFYLSGGTRFTAFTLEGSLDLTSPNDTIRFGGGDNLLAPFGIGSDDWGSLTLVRADQGITGNFNTFDFQGSILKRYNDPWPGGPNLLPKNTYFPQVVGNDLIFHYRIGGTVPEPSTMTMVLVGFVFVRGLRRKYVKFQD